MPTLSATKPGTSWQQRAGQQARIVNAMLEDWLLADTSREEVHRQVERTVKEETRGMKDDDSVANVTAFDDGEEGLAVA